MKTNQLFATAALALWGAAFPTTSADGAPFFDRRGTVFDPEISVVNSGVIHDAQAVVSPDRKYVTLNMRPSNTGLLALRDFAYLRSNRDTAGRGFVGGAGNRAANNAGAGGRGAGAEPSPLDRPGMTRVDRAE